MTVPDIVQIKEIFMATAGPLISAASGLLGVLVGASLNARNERRRLRLAFAQRRLTEFYAPMLGLHKGIRAISNLCVKIGGASEAGWRKLRASWIKLTLRRMQ